jgi:hypothetical protein
MKYKNVKPGKKRVMITVDEEPWERLRAHAKKAGLPLNWLSNEINAFIPGLLAVVELAEQDARDQREMSEMEAMARYGELMAKVMKVKI